MKKEELKESRVSYRPIGKKEEFKIIGIGDPLFQTDAKVIFVMNRSVEEAGCR